MSEMRADRTNKYARCFDPSYEGVENNSNGQQEGSTNYIHADSRYVSEPKGICMERANIADIATEAPNNMLATANRLLIRLKNMYTMCATPGYAPSATCNSCSETRPYRIES